MQVMRAFGNSQAIKTVVLPSKAPISKTLFTFCRSCLKASSQNGCPVVPPLASNLAWKLLKINGVLIWDDYLWQRREYGNKVPKLAIDQFLSGHTGLYEPLWAFKQVAIRKKT
jgi:hypothetical protein